MKRLLVSGVLIMSAWLGYAAEAQESASQTEEIARGKQVYEYWCAPCHAAGLGLPGFGGLPGTQQLSIKYRGTDVPAVLDERTDLVPEFVRTIVRQGISFMPQFRKTEISDADLEALTEYLTRLNPQRQ
jgi:mono/diheme cytochrome c family protein